MSQNRQLMHAYINMHRHAADIVYKTSILKWTLICFFFKTAEITQIKLGFWRCIPRVLQVEPQNIASNLEYSILQKNNSIDFL